MYNIGMINLTITENQGNQRLDRFLKKYFDGAPLSRIYKMIRKDIKINGKRGKEDTLLLPGDQLTLYITESEAASMQKPKKIIRVKRQFKIAYEDENIIVVEKPFGLLTHGDKTEKIRLIASFCGAGLGEAEVEEALKRNADMVVSADIPHHVLLKAIDGGLSVINCTHYASENLGVKRFADYARETLKNKEIYFFCDGRFA